MNNLPTLKYLMHEILLVKKLTEIINSGKMPMANNFVKSKKEKFLLII